MTTIATVRKYLDIAYKVFVVVLLLGCVIVDILHWPAWPSTWHFKWSETFQKNYIKKYNDPLSQDLPVPGGWEAAMYFAEEISVPFLIYFLFAKDGVKKELGAIICFTHSAYSVLLACWEIASFDDSIVSPTQKLWLYPNYLGFGIMSVIMVVDYFFRISEKVEAAEKAKKT